ncbi:6743_t:CDS:2, partial [Racocetra fulgida]
MINIKYKLQNTCFYCKHVELRSMNQDYAHMAKVLIKIYSWETGSYINEMRSTDLMFGGFRNSGPSAALNDIFILDTLSLTWTQGSSVDAPTARADFSATLLNNGLILYIGGGDNINMAEVAAGDTIDPRSGHTAVLSPDGHVIIYGGTKNNSALDQSQQLASLDTTVNPYNNNVYDLNNKNTQLFLLDTQNYMWVTDTLQQPNATTSPNPQNPSVTYIQTVVASNSNALNTGVIVAIPI